ncbi:dihydrolipoyl dehydrogenase family protein [Planococcus lenghuensis]|uniref:Pyridine nucleotide-disulfide oxidoreductase n=1 Tax=Planococcus lenghuensis TaxID=2213202 RepID=A0A1Q2L4Q9_9BACL|nr:NAD(P)/FAD-dependent oxidoreductase [Planococcus lenghuensis]AQQ55403.1 pyridine nucleotide-disulfide oxidoreductase [Planococcus lenghuensis]
MAKEYDLIVIGSGTAGSVTAGKCREAGWSVAMIDELPFGGTCALRGCDPKKVMVGVTEYLDGMERLKGFGLAGDTRISWRDLMQFKRTFTEDVPERRVKRFHERGIDTYHGHAAFIAEDKVQVNDETLQGKKILIATGASPARLPIEGSKYFAYSDDFLELDDLPANILFVGGGYISFEFAHIARRAGADVRILHRGDQPLDGFDSDLVSRLADYSRDLGIDLQLGTDVKEIQQTAAGYNVIGQQGNETKAFKADLVIHGAGRTPNISSLNLEQANVNASRKGIEVNEFLQSTSNPNVYAAGDVAATQGKPLTPVAGMESHIVCSNLLKGNHRTAGDQVMPTSVFTLPKMASVGLSETEADEKGIDCKVNAMELTDWFTYKRTRQPVAYAKILIDQEKDRIVGAHLLGHEADELINHFATAIQFDIPTGDLKRMLFAYPTAASDITYML